MKVMFNRRPVKKAWGGGYHFITCLYEYFSSNNIEVVFDLDSKNIDAIMMFDPRPDEYGKNCVNSIYRYKIGNPSTKIIHRINDTDIARPHDKPWRVELFLASNKIADSTIFISEWVKTHYISKGFDSSKKNSVIINGCSEEFYFPKKNKIFDNTNIKIITHHWSDNYMKGFDVYNFIDTYSEMRKDISFTFLGRYNKDYIPKNTNLIEPKYGIEVGNILRDHDIYVTAARFEACGMHHIEAARSGLPVLFHKDGGAIPEVCKNHGIEFSTPKDFVRALGEITNKFDDIRENIDYNFLSIDRCCKDYMSVIQDIVQ
jgi:glycosyltransferase involved in cell wall biosynthesis